MSTPQVARFRFAFDEVERLRLAFHHEYNNDFSGDHYYGCKHANQYRSTWDCHARAVEFMNTLEKTRPDDVPVVDEEDAKQLAGFYERANLYPEHCIEVIIVLNSYIKILESEETQARIDRQTEASKHLRKRIDLLQDAGERIRNYNVVHNDKS